MRMLVLEMRKLVKIHGISRVTININKFKMSR
jgi:hypothetical protein